MNAQLQRPRRRSRLTESQPKTTPSATGADRPPTGLGSPRAAALKPAFKAMLKVVVLLLLGGLILFAHGCHGDEDNELFAVFRALVGD
jgi:hypothetical protein